MADIRKKFRLAFLACGALLVVSLGTNPASAQLRGNPPAWAAG
jgi:hypothetical protein